MYAAYVSAPYTGTSRGCSTKSLAQRSAAPRIGDLPSPSAKPSGRPRAMPASASYATSARRCLSALGPSIFLACFPERGRRPFHLGRTMPCSDGHRRPVGVLVTSGHCNSLGACLLSTRTIKEIGAAVFPHGSVFDVSIGILLSALSEASLRQSRRTATFSSAAFATVVTQYVVVAGRSGNA